MVLQYQHKFVDQFLSIAFKYDHCLYCMDNETNESPEWGAYWARYIKRRAEEAGVGVELTEMWDDHDVLSDQHKATIDHPELYTFLDLSQNNHQVGFAHWAKPQEIRKRLKESGKIRPINSVKICGANTWRFGTTRDAQERIWRNVASSRFHRPPSGLGINEIAQAHIRALRMATAEIDIFSCEPRLDLLSNRSQNEAYCTANPGVEYLVFFPDGGDVLLNVADAGERPLTVRWLDIRRVRWTGPPQPIRAEGGVVRLVTPAVEGYWAAVVKVV